MRFDTRLVLKDYDNTDIMFRKDLGATIEVVPLTLRDCLIQALNNLAPTENPMAPQEIQTAETKARIYSLSVKLFSEHEVNLTSDEITFLKERVAKIWTANVYGRIVELFDGVQEEPVHSAN